MNLATLTSLAQIGELARKAITGEFGNGRLTKIEIKHQAVPFLWPRKHFQRNFPPALLLKSYFCSK